MEKTFAIFIFILLIVVMTFCIFGIIVGIEIIKWSHLATIEIQTN